MLRPDNSRLLFRFSALTFNAHRIHYDRGYASEVEGYPGQLAEYCVVPDLVETFHAITVKRHFEPPLLKALLGRDQADVLGMAG